MINQPKIFAMPLRLIVCDIEGCLTPPRRGAIPLPEVAPIADYCWRAQSDPALPPLVFCTGRQIPYAECVAQMLNAFFPGLPSVVENGAFLYDIARNEIFPHPLLTEEALGVLSEVRTAARALLREENAVLEAGKEACLSLNPRAGQNVEELYSIASRVLAPFRHAVEITHSKSAVDITPRGIDKAAGVRFLAQTTGIAPEEMLGIGDTRGDLPMLNLVGTACGPANATDEVRAVSTFIASSEGPRGAGEILERFTDWRASSAAGW